MKVPEKPLDIVTESGEIMATASYDETHRYGLRHRSVHILVVNGKGEVFLTKRAKTKRIAPGYYESSVAGHVDTGETVGQAALRELKEELGVGARPEDLQNLGEMQSNVKYREDTIENEITAFFLLAYDGRIAIDTKEIESGSFMKPESITQMIKKNEKFTPGFLELFRRSQQR